MIKHIVSFKLKADSIAQAPAIKARLESLTTKIEQIKFFEVGLNVSKADSAYDLVLVSEFDSLEDLEIYKFHPEHVEVVAFIKPYKLTSMVVDYHFES